MKVTQEMIDGVVGTDNPTRTPDEQVQARQQLAFQIIAANSQMFFQGSDQGQPNQHMQIRQLTNKAFAIAEEALISETKLQHKE